LNSSPEQTYRRFLLGIASSEEEYRVEGAILAGELDALFLVNAEDALIDDYLLGSMTHEERHGFTTHFLATDERRQRLAFASALIEYARKQPVEEFSPGRKPVSHGGIRALLSWKQTGLLAAAASVLLAALAGFQQMQLRRQGQIASETRNELTRLRAALDSTNTGAAQHGERTTESSGNPRIAVDKMPAIDFEFSTRGLSPALLRIPAHAQFVRINLKLSPPLAMKYREVLVASNGDQLWTQEFPASILPTTKESTIVLPASILTPGTYHFRLERASAEEHFEESGDWVFRVEKDQS
jgi:hypothetical protein